MPAHRRTQLDQLGFAWDIHTEMWDEGFRHLLSFFEEHGHSRVPIRFCSTDGYRLGSWVNAQRTKQADVSSEKKSRLNELDFVWEPFSEKWELGFKQLEKYKTAFGHCLVPGTYKVAEDAFALGAWVNAQRTKRDGLTEQKRDRLDALGFVWDVPSDKWNEGFSRLELFKKENGHCRVLVTEKCADGYPLGQWVRGQRTTQTRMPFNRRARLDALGFSWDPLSEQWDEGFRHFADYVRTNNRAFVPYSFVTTDGYKLGLWVANQRSSVNEVSVERKAKLSALGFVWDARESKWQEGYEHLKRYLATVGHCRVPQEFATEDGFRLGQWVGVQRTNRNKISAERKARLDALGFVWSAAS